MSVYKRKRGEKTDDTYSYEFQLQGRRFSGNTGCRTKREAQAFEQSRKEQARIELNAEAAFFAERMTFEIAASRWWLEIGQHQKSTDTILRNLEWLKKWIGADKPLEEITDSVIAALVARRRGERVPIRMRNGKIKPGKLVSPATVNRTCTQPLREIILRAKNVWKVQVADVDFGRHILKEPQERVREASCSEEDAILAQLGRGYDEAVRFAFLTGCRRMEILGLEWPQVDFFSQRFTVTGKGNKVRTIPMSEAIYQLLWEQKDHHPVKVFTYEAARTKKAEGLVRGQRYPLTESGLKTAMRRAVPAAGVANFRFHDTRHTAATRILRASNLRVAQRLLGHRDIATTTKYAHAMDDDLRQALEATTTTKSPTKKTAGEDKAMNSNGKKN